MNDRDDYLWDPTAAPDPELAALERALAPLRHTPAPFVPLPVPVPPPVRRRAAAWLVAAVIVLAVGLGWGLGWPWSGGGTVAPRPEAIVRSSAPRTFVAADAARTIPLGDLAEITLRPGSELAFVHWRDDQALFSLTRGGLTARVEPPPKVQKGFFVVDTPLGRVVDQGCRYDLDLLADGTAKVRVTEGAVTFAAGERVVFVPAGASVEIGPWGPGTPCFDDAELALLKAVRFYDGLVMKGVDRDVRGKAVDAVLGEVRTPRDALVSWHLLRDPEPMHREAVEAHLLGLVGPPLPSKERSFDPEVWLPFLRLLAWQPR